MAQTGYTPISIYYSSTTTNVPTAGNLVAGELAINTADGKLFYKDSSGVVQVIGTKGGVGSSTTTQVLYNSSGLVVGSANMTFDGSTLTTLNSAYTGTLTGGTGVVNLGSAQFYKDASGNIGLGTSSLSNKLTIFSTSTSNASILSASDDGSGNSLGIIATYGGAGQANPRAQLGLSGYVGYLKLTDGGNTLQTNLSATGTSYMAVSNFYVGSTSAPVVGTEKFGVQGGTGIAGTFGTTSTSIPTTQIANGANGTVTLLRFSAGSSGNTVGNITSNGTLTVYGTTSDYRLKIVIGNISDSGARIDALEPIEYDWNNGEGRTKGFLAHKFSEVYPNSVSGEKDAVDKNGKPVYQSMQASSSEVMADLIAEIQSLRKRIATLEAK